MEWSAAFGVTNTWVSDQGTHLQNETIRELYEKLKSHHHCNFRYCPVSNSTVEVTGWELKKLPTQFATRSDSHP